MRNLLLTTGLTLLATTAACSDSPSELKDPPFLKVTSPKRSLIQDGAGMIQVTGTVAPNDLSGEPIQKVLVNNVQATVNADGTFTATIQVPQGATLIHTEARDAAGKLATDTRAVHAGELRPVGANIDDALTAALSTTAFAKLSAAAGPMIEGLDMAALLAPMQPMVHMGDEAGPDCLYARLYVNDVKMTNVDISLTPTDAGLSFRAQIDGLDVPSLANYAVSCLDGSNTIRVTADRVVVAGMLVVTPDGNKGFKTALADETVDLTNMQVMASGVPGDIIDMLNLDSAIAYIVSTGAEMAMEPMMNQALGGLAGPQQVDVLGKTVHIEVDPTAVDIDATGALITLSTKVLIEGSESSPGFIFTANGLPNLDPGNGLQIGLADDLANEMMSELTATGLLNLEMPAHGGTFDSTAIAMTLPPMISADPADGKMKVVLGDMIATYADHGTPVAKAAINALVDLEVVPANNGYGIALQLGKPTAQVNVLDDIANATRLTNADLAQATEDSLGAQIDAISKLLVAIPLPAVGGLQMRNVALGSDSGYVMLTGEIE